MHVKFGTESVPMASWEGRRLSAPSPHGDIVGVSADALWRAGDRRTSIACSSEGARALPHVASQGQTIGDDQDQPARSAFRLQTMRGQQFIELLSWNAGAG